MGPLSEVPLMDAASAAAGDEAAVAAGTSWAALMERAAGHLARGVVALAGRGYGLKVAFVVGKGNNGGDGWAAARRVGVLGAQARVVAVHGIDAETSGEAAANRRRFLAGGGRASGPERLDDVLSWCDVAVDCLLGTGATGAPRGAIGETVAALIRARDRGTAVVACDVPTGVQVDDGVVPGVAVRADLTVTLGGWKRGLLLHPGAGYAGRVTVGELGPTYAPPGSPWVALTAAGAAPPELAPADDKRDRGVVLIVAGSVGMAGAAILCARGAVAAGAGLVTVAVPQRIQDVVANAVPPAMTIGLDDAAGAVAPSAAAAVLEQAARSDVVVVGPGMTPGKGTREVVDAVLGASVRAVLDADAINVFRDEGEALARHAGELVLTPHMKELARIGPYDDAGDAWDRRAASLPGFAAELGATIVAKGPGTLVAAPDGRVWVTPTGGPALGTGGSGDVLAGAVAAGVACADDVAAAVARACWWHGLAGQLAGAAAADLAGSEDIARALTAALAATGRLAMHRPGWPFDAPGWRPGRPPPPGDGPAAPAARRWAGSVVAGADREEGRR